MTMSEAGLWALLLMAVIALVSYLNGYRDGVESCKVPRQGISVPEIAVSPEDRERTSAALEAYMSQYARHFMLRGLHAHAHAHALPAFPPGNKEPGDDHAEPVRHGD